MATSEQPESQMLARFSWSRFFSNFRAIHKREFTMHQPIRYQQVMIRNFLVSFVIPLPKGISFVSREHNSSTFIYTLSPAASSRLRKHQSHWFEAVPNHP